MVAENDFVAANATIESGGQTYTLSPLTIRDYVELEQILRDEPLSTLRSVVRGMDQDAARYLLDQAKAEAKLLRYGTREFAEAAMSLYGNVQILRLSLRHNHPDLSVSMAADILENVTDYKRAFTLILGMAGLAPSFFPTGATQKETENAPTAMSQSTSNESIGV